MRVKKKMPEQKDHKYITIAMFIGNITIMFLFMYFMIEYGTKITERGIITIIEGREAFRAGGYDKLQIERDTLASGKQLIEQELQITCDNAVGMRFMGLITRNVYYNCVNASNNTMLVEAVYGRKIIPDRGQYDDAFTFDALCSYTPSIGAGRVIENCM